MSNELMQIQSRPAETSLVETVWQSQSQQSGDFLSIASSRLELVFSNFQGEISCTVRGPETYPTVAHCPPDGEWFGVQFKHGVFLSNLPTSNLVDGEVTLPQASSQRFWLDSNSWEFPTYDNVEVFIERLIKEEVLVCDTAVTATLQAHPTDLSPRSIQRRFRRATGLTHSTIFQIERAQFALSLLQSGVSILETVSTAEYADQPHMTRSLKRLIGQTPAQLASDTNPTQFSFFAENNLIANHCDIF